MLKIICFMWAFAVISNETVHLYNCCQLSTFLWKCRKNKLATCRGNRKYNPRIETYVHNTYLKSIKQYFGKVVLASVKLNDIPTSSWGYSQPTESESIKMGSIEKACISGFLCRLCSEMHRTVIHIYSDHGQRLCLVEKINGYLPITVSIAN